MTADSLEYARPMGPVVEHDRRVGLRALGILSLCLAAMSACVACVLLLGFLTRLSQMSGAFWRESLWAIAAGAVGWTILLTWAGIDSIRLKKWVRPVVLAAAWPAAVAGVLALAGWLIMLKDFPAMTLRSTWKLEMIVEAAVLTVMLAAPVAGCIVYVWFYSLRSVGRTLEAYDPGRSWTEKCPLPVFILSGCLIQGGLLTIGLASHQQAPVFGTYWEGPQAFTLIVVTGLGLMLAGVEVHSGRVWGWWLGLAIVVAGFTSAGWTMGELGMLEFYKRGGATTGDLRMLGNSPVMSGGTPVGFVAAAMGIAVGVMVGCWRYLGTKALRHEGT